MYKRLSAACCVLLLAGGGRRATAGRPAAAAKSDSLDLDDELLPDGSTAKGALRLFAAVQSCCVTCIVPIVPAAWNRRHPCNL
jgi:hypothetical protein